MITALQIVIGLMMIRFVVKHLNWIRTRGVSARDVYVIDGDTIGLRRRGRPDERIRISNIDAPETRGIKSLWEGRKGEAAKDALRDMIWLAETIEIVGWGRRDRYGRTLARIAIVAGDRRFDIGKSMISRGHARRWT
ncbi:thermonuclease family protein [Microvirga tunisiensis]|uniref:Thermonuclease family protein n=1 Tax=Microvirga tunisiensis TaxID=2108360 RepID=A0A5N7MMV6_9HYPH|nr:thermonuclease family protein [Microvirga tunisiensis]MPR10130.1 thermonuclease family protein [Microvirga tunisiensis]MPR28337.1 thermonuclease family protein [Microvirga tunisiensis]